MKLGAEDKKKALIAGGAGVLFLGLASYMYFSYFSGATPPPHQAPIIVDNSQPTASTPGAATRTVTAPPGNVVAGAAEKVGTTSGALDPTLHEEAMLNTESLVYSGTGRNIFSGISEAPPPLPPTTVPKTEFIARTPIPVPPQQPQGPVIQPPPPINLKFFGTSVSTSSGVRKAWLLGGDDVFLASAGDVVQRKYRVVSISPSTVLIEDIPNANKQTVPLIPQ